MSEGVAYRKERMVASGWFLVLALTGIGCRQSTRQEFTDHPRLPPGVKIVDVSFHSGALNRDMQYRAVLPASVPSDKKLSAIYLLHGNGGGFRDWSNYSDIARYAEHGLILVMPEGGSSYYVNSAEHPQDRYEDYIVHDLIADVERRFPVSGESAHRAIAGISMGGFGAVVLALKHPDLFEFAGGLSSAVDVPSRPFSIKRVGQWREHSAIFGPWKSETRKNNDPYLLARSADPSHIPYLYLSCGEQEGLLQANRKFASLLKQRHFQYEFHSVSGGHDWNQWNRLLPELMDKMELHLAPKKG